MKKNHKIHQWIGGYQDPDGLTFDASGNLLASVYNQEGEGNPRIVILPPAPEIPTQEKIFVQGEWESAVAGIAVDLDGDVFVVDESLKKIRVFYPSGAKKLEFGESGPAADQFLRPLYIAVDTFGKILVSDFSNPKISVWSKEGVWQKNIGVGVLSSPCGLCVDFRTGNIVVCDTSANLVRTFDKFGTSLRAFGRNGSDGFSNAWGLALDIEGTIIVADMLNSRVQIFTSEGEFLRSLEIPDGGIPRSCIVNKDGDILVSTETQIWAFR